MATNQKPPKTGGAGDLEPTSIQPDNGQDSHEPPVLPVSVEPEAAEHSAEESVEAAAISVSVAFPSSEPSADRSVEEFDLNSWSLKMLNLFNENAAAILDFAAAFARAKSVSEALELQSRFANERYSTLLRQTEGFAELMRRMTLETAPFRMKFFATWR